MSKNLTLDRLKEATQEINEPQQSETEIPQELKSILANIPSREQVEQLTALLATAQPPKRKSRKRIAAPPSWGLEARSVRKSIMVTPYIHEKVLEIAENKRQSFNNAVEEALRHYIDTEGFTK